MDKQTEMPKKRDEKYLPLYEQINVAKAVVEDKEKIEKKHLHHQNLITISEERLKVNLGVP